MNLSVKSPVLEETSHTALRLARPRARSLSP